MSGTDEGRQAALWLTLYRELGVEGVRPRRDAREPARRPIEMPPLLGTRAEDREAIEAVLQTGEPERALERLAREVIGDCRRCRLAAGRTKIVFGVGDPRARLMFVGEGPGADEDRQGEPFVGRAGKLLDRIIAAMGLARPEVYIANVVKCRPPGNRAPNPDESAACLPFLRAQIAIIAPEVIVALGRTALEGLLGERIDAMGRARRRWYELAGIPVKPTFHPAYLLRNPAAKKDVWEDMQQVMERLGLPLPGRP